MKYLKAILVSSFILISYPVIMVLLDLNQFTNRSFDNTFGLSPKIEIFITYFLYIVLFSIVRYVWKSMTHNKTND